MVALSFREDVAIAQLVFYCPALVLAVFLAIRHGFGKSAGWFYLILFSIARVLAGAFRLALANAAPSSVFSLYIGETILLGIGPSQLELVCLGLLSRVLTSINMTTETVITQRHSRLVQLLTLVGLIVGIIGGVKAGEQLGETGVYAVQTLSKVSVALFLTAFVLLAIGTAATFSSISHAAPGEKRILAVVAVTLPFLLVRLIFSVMSTFFYSPEFNAVAGNTTIYLCMSFLTEVVIVLIIEAVGLTLKKVQPFNVADAQLGYATDSRKLPYAQSGGIHWNNGNTTDEER